MDETEIITEMFTELSDEAAPIDFQGELIERLDTIIENQSEISAQLQVVIDRQSDIQYGLLCIFGLALLAAAFKIVWTVVAKWLFGGV